MTAEQQAFTDEMIDHLARRLDGLWEDGEHFTAYDEFGGEVEFSINKDLTAPIKARILATAREDVQRLPTLLGDQSRNPDYLQRFADRYCQQARTQVQEKCDEISREFRNEIFEV